MDKFRDILDMKLPLFEDVRKRRRITLDRER